MSVSVIIAAGGQGTRLGAGVPKQWLAIGGRTLLERSVAAFDAHPRVTEIVIVVPPGSDRRAGAADDDAAARRDRRGAAAGLGRRGLRRGVGRRRR